MNKPSGLKLKKFVAIGLTKVGSPSHLLEVLFVISECPEQLGVQWATGAAAASPMAGSVAVYIHAAMLEQRGVN